MDIYKPLKQYFGYQEFRSGQEELVRGIIAGRDCLGIMPTGGGKSLCFQLPALLLPGITLVISPLIALMKDQVDNLNEMGISATFINSSLDNDELASRVNEVRQGRFKIVYLAPERLDYADFLMDADISLVAIDEAHCISQWGHDFRPSYVRIPKFIAGLQKRPVVAAFTATATRTVVREIESLLGLKNPVSVNTGFDRPNLFYSVVKAGDKLAYVLDFLGESPGKSGIIYCATRKTVESLSSKLAAKGFAVVAYHGGMDAGSRQASQEDFIYNRKSIIVATNAFGMGIDKPDVRFVLHYNMPKNMEAYYQEAGRAGRDGEDAKCILMYSPADVVKQKMIANSTPMSPEREELMLQNLQYLIDYCHTDDCLRGKILNYFGEEGKAECGTCGNCQFTGEYVDVTVEAQKILSCIYRTGQKFGSSLIAGVLKGSRNKRIYELGLDQVSTYGLMENFSPQAIGEIIMNLAARDYIMVTPDKFPVLKLTPKSRLILRGEEKLELKKELVERKEKNKVTVDVQNHDQGLFQELKKLRYDLSQQKQVPPFVIFSDKTLVEMAATYPHTQSELLAVSGVGAKKMEEYGEVFLGVIKDYCSSKGIDGASAGKTHVKEIEKPQEKSEGQDRYRQTYDLYKQGLSLSEMAKERGLSVTTILRHLGKCQDQMDVDWSRFIDDVKEKLILQAITENGADKLKPIKEALPDDISYEDIWLVLYKHQVRD